MLNISYLQLKSGNDSGFASEASPSTGSSAMDDVMSGFEIKKERASFGQSDERRGGQIDASIEDPEVALFAINFILAYVPRL